MDGFRYDSKEGLACRLGVSSAQVRDPGPCKVIVQRCEDKVGGHLGIERFAGAASVARDMFVISLMLGQDKWQYYGFVSALRTFLVCHIEARY